MGVVVKVLRAVAAGLGFVLGAAWILVALAVPIDELGRCSQGTSEDLFALFGIAASDW